MVESGGGADRREGRIRENFDRLEKILRDQPPERIDALREYLKSGGEEEGDKKEGQADDDGNNNDDQ